MHSAVTPEEAVRNLKAAAPLYKALRHENLIELLEDGPMGGGWGLLFRWTDGISMGRMYPAQHRRFVALPQAERLQIFEDILRFHIHAAEKGMLRSTSTTARCCTMRKAAGRCCATSIATARRRSSTKWAGCGAA